MMTDRLIAAAKNIYDHTPLLSLRKLYFATFCSLVRNRKSTATVDGMTFELDLGETIDVALFLNKFEPDVSASIEQYCQPGWVVLDIGANIGAHSLRFSKCTGPTGATYAFEPTFYAFSKLRKNMSLNPGNNICAHRVALSNRSLNDQMISFRSSWRTDGSYRAQREAVDFVRLDDWCAAQRLDRVDLVKLDVDGNEYQVIDGARATFASFRPVVFIEAAGYHFENDLENPLYLLSEMGYSFRGHGPKADVVNIEWIRNQLSIRPSDRTFSINLIATP